MKEKLLCYNCKTPQKAEFEVQCNDDDMRKPVCEYHLVEYLRGISGFEIECKAFD